MQDGQTVLFQNKAEMAQISPPFICRQRQADEAKAQEAARRERMKVGGLELI